MKLKPLIRLSCLVALIYLQSCGGAIKNKDTDSAKTAAGTKPPVPNATTNLVVNDEKDMIGYWVGMFLPDVPELKADTTTADTTNTEDFADESPVFGDYDNKINISIDEINGDKVKGHSVVAGNIRPFEGTVTKDGPTYHFAVNEPGDDKYDGKFKFSIRLGDKFLAGVWQANKQVKKPKKKYKLEKKIFKYNPDIMAEESARYVDWKKQKAVKYKYDDTTSVVDTNYFTTSADVDKYNASKQVITKEQAANLKKADLIVLRNTIFARHGYAFKKPQLRAYFDYQDWYIPLSTDVQSDLTPLEKQNIATLKRYEKNSKDYYDRFGR